MRAPLLVLALAAAGCGEPTPAPPPRAATAEPPPRAPTFATDDAAWGRFHSKRFQLSVPLPEGRTWRIDDRSRPFLLALHEPTSSRVTIQATREDELVNRAACEARARAAGLVPSAPLTTVEDHVTIGPEAYDSRVWVALEHGAPGGALEGHVFLFGAFVRRCLFVHVATRVPRTTDDEVLSQRLAVARARIVGGIALDPPRTTGEAEVPRDEPGRAR